MSEIARDAGRVVDRVGEVASQIGQEIDKAYVAAKDIDWSPVVLVIILLASVGFVMGLVQVLLDARKSDAPTNPAADHPLPGDIDYLDWANRTGKYATPVANGPGKDVQGPIRW